jgi:O-antigen/teichoic acid export membrane protein
MKLNHYIDRFLKLTWHSPTVTTWGSFLSRGISLILVLPLVLTKFSSADIALWYLFLTIIGLQPLADMGFGFTFVRVIAFAMGGAKRFDDLRTVKNQPKGESQKNWISTEKIVSTMYYVYNRLTPIIFILLLIVGTISLIKPISYTDNTQTSWISWFIILLTTTILFRGTIYTNYLQGINKIALFRRWQSIFSIGTTLSSFLVLWFDGNILLLVISYQMWAVLNVIRNYYFCCRIDDKRFRKFKNTGKDDEIYKAVWPSAWRSGVGVILYSVVVQASGLIYAQVGSVTNVASYLLGLRILNNIRSLSQAPFYSKIPLLSRLRAEGNQERQVAIARKGMILSYWVFVIGFIAFGLIAAPLLRLIGSNADFVPPLLWASMGFGYFLERYGAMHIQLYSTTNHIILHIANGVSGAIYLVSSLVLLYFIDVYAFPVAIIISQLGFYTWYSARHSYNTFNLNFWKFEKNNMLIPLMLIILFSLFAGFHNF